MGWIRGEDHDPCSGSSLLAPSPPRSGWVPWGLVPMVYLSCNFGDYSAIITQARKKCELNDEITYTTALLYLYWTP